MVGGEKMPNLGGYDINSFYDSRGNAFLTEFLEKDCLIKTDIKKDDKAPNLDGTIELLKEDDKKFVPVQIFHVQVKTLNSDYTNENKRHNISQYKYPAETKVFNVVKEHITSDPVILFLVDTKRRKVFWIYVSIEYVMKLDLKEEENKTIYFNDADSIGDIDSFYKVLENIHKECVEKNKSWQNNIITSNHTMATEKIKVLHKEWDYLNEMLTKKFRIAVEYLYPEAWKFGIAYQEGEKYDLIGIYQIKLGDGGRFIKEFSNKETDCFTVCTYKKDAFSVRDIINKQIGLLAEKYYKSGRIPVQCLPNVVLEEVAFHFLDVMAGVCDEFADKEYKRIYYKRYEEVIRIKEIWQTLIEYSKQKNHFVVSKYASTPYVTAEVDPISELLNHNREIRNKAKEKFCELLNDSLQNENDLPYPLVFSKKYKYSTYGEVIKELEKRGIMTVNRPWEPKKFEQMFEQHRKLGIRGLHCIETGYLIEDIYSNFEKMLKIFADAYKHTSESMWGTDVGQHIIKKRYSVSFDNADIYHNYYYLVKDCENIEVSVNEYSVEELEKFAEDVVSWKEKGVKLLGSGNFTTCVRTDLFLYDNIWYLLNKEMWDGCDIRKPTHGVEYIWK